MNELANGYGLVGCAVLAAGFVSLLLKNKKFRLITTVLVFTATLVPITSSKLPAASYIFGFFDVPSLSTLFLALYIIISGFEPKKVLEFKTTLWFAVAFICGAIVYFSEFNFISADVYCLGYLPIVGYVVALICLIFGNLPVAYIATLGVIGQMLNVYPNYFDSCLDPLFWFVTTIIVITQMIRRSASQKKEVSPSK